MIQITHESHEAPGYVAQALERAGGINRFGEPNFRAVWGWNRLGWIGGRWTDLDASGSVAREVIELRYTQKYSAHNRWHIERWCAPEMYGSPENWAQQTLEIEDGRNISALGPFPARGEYEHVFTLEKVSRTDPAREDFVQLTPTIAEHLCRMIEVGRSKPQQQSRESLYRREEMKDREYDSWADGVLSG
jgi:hypothetical protein